jgi:hypothetical protein
MRMPREPLTRPITIQGRRMPSRDEVRSLILPKNGFPTIANRAPIPVTTAKLLGACSIPTSELTFNAKVTSSGARNTRQLLMNANVYRAMNPIRPGVPRPTSAPAQPRLRCRALRSPKAVWSQLLGKPFDIHGGEPTGRADHAPLATAMLRRAWA